MVVHCLPCKAHTTTCYILSCTLHTVPQCPSTCHYWHIHIVKPCTLPCHISSCTHPQGGWHLLVSLRGIRWFANMEALSSPPPPTSTSPLPLKGMVPGPQRALEQDKWQQEVPTQTPQSSSCRPHTGWVLFTLGEYLFKIRIIHNSSLYSQ